MRAAVEIRGLRKRYGSHVVLKGVDLKIRPGEIFALLGSNGAGKTTTLECLEGLRNYEDGSITVNGSMGVQLQSAALPEDIRPLEAVRLFAKCRKTAVDDKLLEILSVRELGKKRYGQLSTGQKRRVHLALALLGDPDILVLDEPTAGLDVEGRAALHAQIRSWRDQGKTIILASHDMAEVEALCDRIAVLEGGKIVFAGAPSRLARTGETLYRIRLETEKGSRTIQTAKIADTLLGLLEECRREDVEILDLRVDRGTLETHVLELGKETAKEEWR